MQPNLTMPVTSLIVSLSEEDNQYLDSEIRKEITNLLDIVLFRVGSKMQPEKLAEGLVDSVFNVRIKILHWLSTENEDVSSYLNILNKEAKYLIEKHYTSDVGVAMVDSLILFADIGKKIFDKTEIKNFSQLREEIANIEIQYSTINFLASALPTHAINNIKKWIDASLSTELGLIVAELILKDKVKVSKATIAEYTNFLRLSSEKFGAYSILIKIWEPDQDDDNQFLQNVRILASRYELESGNGMIISNLKEILTPD